MGNSDETKGLKLTGEGEKTEGGRENEVNPFQIKFRLASLASEGCQNEDKKHTTIHR